MSSFNATAMLQFENLDGAKRQLESELSPVEIDVSASDQLANGGGSAASSALAAGGAASAADGISDNVELSEVRNDILRDILDATRKSGAGGGGFAFLPRGAGNILRSLGGAGGAAAAVIAGSLSAVAWGPIVADAIGDIDVGPEDILDPAVLTAPALIAGKVTLEAADVVAEGATVTASHLIENPASIAVPALITGKVAIEAADLIGDVATVTLDKLIDVVKGNDTSNTTEDTETSEDSSTNEDASGNQQETNSGLGLGELAAGGVFAGGAGYLLSQTISTGGGLFGASAGAGLAMDAGTFNRGLQRLDNLGGTDATDNLPDGVSLDSRGPVARLTDYGDAVGDALNLDGRDPALEAGTSSYRAPQDMQLADDGSGRNTVPRVPEVNVTVRNQMDVSQSMSRQEFRRKFEDEVKDDLIRELYDNLTGSGTGVLP